MDSFAQFFGKMCKVYLAYGFQFNGVMHKYSETQISIGKVITNISNVIAVEPYPEGTHY